MKSFILFYIMFSVFYVSPAYGLLISPMGKDLCTIVTTDNYEIIGTKRINLIAFDQNKVHSREKYMFMAELAVNPDKYEYTSIGMKRDVAKEVVKKNVGTCFKTKHKNHDTDLICATWTGECDGGMASGIGKLVILTLGSSCTYKSNSCSSNIAEQRISYFGLLKHGKMHTDSKGTLYNEITGLPIYIGGFKNGRFHGYGIEFYKGFIYKGLFKNGLKHGEGIIYFDDGLINFKGTFNNDSPMNGTLYNKSGDIVYSGNVSSNDILSTTEKSISLKSKSGTIITIKEIE